ncbi:MAG: tRNA (adenosine(37)-N6)-threonylcarbamoyltransferase complex dimerization subunit type 1 TsaB, partial [Acidimicrobiales bacterium]
RSGRRHAESLAPAIAHVIEQTGTSLAEVETVAVDVGPGLYTGLRVGVATAQGLAQGLGIGVLCVTSVAVLAHAAYEGGWPGAVATVVDARRGEVFAAVYRGAGNESHPPVRCAPDALGDLLWSVAADTGGPVLVVGNGTTRYADALRPVAGAGAAVVGGPALADPSPAALVALAAGRLAAGQVPVPPGDVRPVYLREPDARINWPQR